MTEITDEVEEQPANDEINDMLDDMAGETYEGENNENDDSAKKTNGRAEQEQPSKRKYMVCKYANRQRIPLHEAVIINGIPCFLYYDNGNLKVVSQIEENSRILRPPNSEEYPYIPYEFDDEKELSSLLEEVRNHQDIAYYYNKCKSIFLKYNNQDGYKISLAAADITWTYHQDKFATAHYLNIIGDNGSGKSSLGLCFEVLAYRPVNMTNPSAANLFRALGTIEPGQCIIIAEEADKIDKNPEISSILKTGYHIMGKVAKVNLNIQKQEFFWTYCFKVIISERSLSRETAKGVLDRYFVIHTFSGKSDCDIKEVLNPVGDETRKALFNEIMRFRKLMLIYRQVHYSDPIPDIDIGLDGRDKELCKPLRQLFWSSEDDQVKKEIEHALDHFLKKKKASKRNLFEVSLLPIIAKLITTHGVELRASHIWQSITEEVEGTHDQIKQPNEYHTADFGTIYRRYHHNPYL